MPNTQLRQRLVNSQLNVLTTCAQNTYLYLYLIQNTYLGNEVDRSTADKEVPR